MTQVLIWNSSNICLKTLKTKNIDMNTVFYKELSYSSCHDVFVYADI